MNLKNLRIACFYPWPSFKFTGSWSRFSSFWHFLLHEGAEVTLAFLDAGTDAKLDRVAVRYFGINPGTAPELPKITIAEKLVAELQQFSAQEADIILRFDKQLYLRAPGLAAWVEELAKDHDVVTCEYPFFAPLLSDICRRVNKRLLITSHDALFELHGVHPLAREQLKKQEIQALRLADARVYCNEKEQAFFSGFGLEGSLVINTGDALRIEPGDTAKSREELCAAIGIKTPHYCLFVGSQFGPNVDAVAEIRKLAEGMPEVTFVVAGGCSPRVAERNFVAVAEVPTDLLDRLYRSATAVLVPVRKGTGVSVKIFEALAYGKVVISTAVGVRGYTFSDGETYLPAESIADFGDRIRSVMADASLRAKVEAGARKYALSLDYRTHFKPYVEIITRLACKTSEAAEGRRAAGLVVVDNNLSGRIGHHYNYALSLKDECKKQGHPFAALVHRTAPADVTDDLGAAAVFSQGIHEKCPVNPYPADWQPIHDIYDFLRAADLFSREMETGITSRAGVGDTVFIPNAMPAQVLGLALLLARSPLHSELNYVLIVRYSLFFVHGPLAARKIDLDKQMAERYVMAFERLAAADRNGKVRLATDSAELAREYSAIAKKPIEVLPIPHTAGDSAAPNGLIPEKKVGKVRIVYCGDAREEKGFELLPALAKALGAGPWRDTTECVFQAFVSSVYHERMRGFIEEMEQLKLPNLTLLRETLSATAYQKLLNSADVVLIPYDAATYRSRTSGPFVEALCAGKTVVIPKNSWMSNQLGASAAGASFTSGNAQEFVRAVQSVCLAIETHRRSADQLGNSYRQYHNPENFVRTLMKSAKK